MATQFFCCFGKSNTRVAPIIIQRSVVVTPPEEAEHNNILPSKMLKYEVHASVEGQKSGPVSEAGHVFKKKTFHKPTFCHHCSDLLWGLTNQGMHCAVCGYVSHERCQSLVITSCNIKASSFIQIPRLHRLVKLTTSKKKFCHVCRKRIDDAESLKCQICLYHVHQTCRKHVVHGCKATASYNSCTKDLEIKQYHHWCEGHLPVHSKCKVCSKNCSSNECLTGLRCSWCLSVVHSYCVNQLPRNCEFGSLRDMVLLPYAVKALNIKAWSSRYSHGDSNGVKETNMEKHPLVATESSHVLRVYEGSIARPTCWTNVSITRNTTTAEVLVDVLKQSQIKDEKSKYFLTRVLNNVTEVNLQEFDKPWKFVKNENNPQVFLRHQKLDKKELKMTIYAGCINAMLPSIPMKINMMTHAKEIVIKALKQFQFSENEDPNKYCITHMKISSNRISETNLKDEESIYEVLVEKRKQTMQELHSTRFYLQPKEDPFTDVSLYIGNLPIEMTMHQYNFLLSDIIGLREHKLNIVAAFPVQGAVVVQFTSIEIFLNTLQRINNATIEGRTIFLQILPEIKEDMLPKGTSPVIIFVNRKSGGGQGLKILTTFNRLLNPYQVVDLLDGGPLPALYLFRNLKQFRILICGGDGTFGWVLSCLEDIRYNILRCKQPASGLLPLGTGNDLSRILNWGAGYSGDSLLSILTSLSYAAEVMLDRWNIVIYDEKQTKENEVNIVPMNNYFGVGIDAELCLDFHLSREENPEKFNSRLHNKGVYFKAGLRKLNRSSMSNLQDKLQITIDGKETELPSIEGLAITNISSWAGGSDPWGKDRDEKFLPPSYSDGLLEVIGFTGVYHMGKIKSGLSTGIRIAQGTQINITLKDNLPVQVDGEPWLQPIGSIMIRPTLQQVKMLVKPALFRSSSE